MFASIKYFVKESRYMLLFSLVYSVFMFLITNEPDDDPVDFIVLIVFTGALCMMIFSITMFKKDIPLAICFSQKRSEVFVGTLVFCLCEIIYANVECFIAKVVIGINVNMFHVAIVASLIIVIAFVFGVMIGMFWQKFGRVAAVVAMFLLSASTGVLVSIGIIQMQNGVMIDDIYQSLFGARNAVLVVILIICGVILWLHRRTIMNYNANL